MLTGAKLKIIVRGVKIKVQRGEDLEEILESYGKRPYGRRETADKG